jgi:hypothetical protein
MPKVIKEDIANQIANEVLTFIKSKDNTFKSNQVVAILNAARVIEMNARSAKEVKAEDATQEEPVTE